MPDEDEFSALFAVGDNDNDNDTLDSSLLGEDDTFVLTEEEEEKYFG